MSEYKKSAIQRLSETSDLMEIWWDSSPLIFNKWMDSVIEKAKPEDKEKLKAQLKVLFDTDNPGDCLFDGVTTNPKLTNTALGMMSEEMNPIIDEIIEGNKAKITGLEKYIAYWYKIRVAIFLRLNKHKEAKKEFEKINACTCTHICFLNATIAAN